MTKLPVVAAAFAALALAGCGDNNDDSAPEQSQTPGPAAEASGGEVVSPSGQKLGVEFDAEPAKAGAVGVAFDTRIEIGTDSGADPSPPVQMTVRVQKGFKLNAAAFPQCALADLEAGRLARCSAAQVGSGEAELIGPKGRPLRSRLTIYNGKPDGGNPTALYYINTPGYDPIPVSAPIVREPRGDYDLKVGTPRIPGNPPLRSMRLHIRDVSAEEGGRTVHLIEAPRSCAGTWQFRAEGRFESGETLTVVSPLSCSS